MGGGTGGRGDGRDRSPANFSAFNIMPMGGTWKESTLNGPRPPPQSSRRGAALAWGWQPPPPPGAGEG